MDKYIKPYYSPRYPVVYFDADTNDRVVELTSTINDYLLMMDAKFITGSESLSGIDSYLERLKSLGIEELQRIYQDAYNVYLGNLSR
jgi:putative aldouronate transport system substrate-binding protein